MKRLLTLPVVALALLITAVPADAKKRPTERARIHSLEKKVVDLQADVSELLDRVTELEAGETKTNGLLRQCFFAFPIQTNLVATTPNGDPVQVFGINFTTPSAWLAAVNPSCLSAGFMPGNERMLR